MTAVKSSDIVVDRNGKGSLVANKAATRVSSIEPASRAKRDGNSRFAGSNFNDIEEIEPLLRELTGEDIKRTTFGLCTKENCWFINTRSQDERSREEGGSGSWAPLASSDGQWPIARHAGAGGSQLGL